MVAQEVARGELEILEVERRLAFLRGRVRLGEPREQLLQQLVVACGELVERRPLDGLASLLVGRRALAARPQRREIEQPLGQRRLRSDAERLLGVRALVLGRRRVGGEAACRLLQLGEPLLEPRSLLVEGQLEGPPGRAQRLVDAGEHPPQPAGAVGGEQLEPLGLAALAEGRERRLERLAADHTALALVEDAEARIQPGRERMRLQQSQAEAVDRRDPGAVELAREVVTASLGERRADPRAQLAGRALGVGDDEVRLDVEATLADRAHEPLDEHARLSGPRTRRHEHEAVGVDGGELLGVQPRELIDTHARRTLHIGQRSHHDGHSPPFGSWWTSPCRIRSPKPRA